MYSHFEHESEQSAMKARIQLRGGVSRTVRANSLKGEVNNGAPEMLLLDPDLRQLVRQSNPTRPSRRQSVGGSSGGGVRSNTLPLPLRSLSSSLAMSDVTGLGSIVE